MDMSEVAMMKTVILDTLDQAGGELDALTLFTRVIKLTGDNNDPMAVIAAIELEPTDIISITTDGRIKLKQESQNLGGE